MEFLNIFSSRCFILSSIAPSTIWSCPKLLLPSSHTKHVHLHPWNRCSIVSSISLHKAHLNGPFIPLFLMFSQVRTLPLKRSQTNNMIFSHNPWLYNLTHFFSEGMFAHPLANLVASLMLKVYVVPYPHLNLSGPPRRSIFLRWSSWESSMLASPGRRSKNQASSFHSLNVLSMTIFSQ